MHVCVCVCIYIYIYIYRKWCCQREYIQHTPTKAHTRTYTQIHARTGTRYTYTHTYIHIYIHTHKCIHLHHTDLHRHTQPRTDRCQHLSSLFSAEIAAAHAHTHTWTNAHTHEYTQNLTAAASVIFSAEMAVPCSTWQFCINVMALRMSPPETVIRALATCTCVYVCMYECALMWLSYLCLLPRQSSEHEQLAHTRVYVCMCARVKIAQLRTSARAQFSNKNTHSQERISTRTCRDLYAWINNSAHSHRRLVRTPLSSRCHPSVSP
jgi:hypothetical protein